MVIMWLTGPYCARARARIEIWLDANQMTRLAPAPARNGPVSQMITNNVLVMPIKFTDSPASDPFTPAQVDQVMRTNAGRSEERRVGKECRSRREPDD